MAWPGAVMPPHFPVQPMAILNAPIGLLDRLFKETLSKDEEHNIIRNAWLAILGGHGDNWTYQIKWNGYVHKVNLQQSADPNTWFFEFNTERVGPEIGVVQCSR